MKRILLLLPVLLVAIFSNAQFRYLKANLQGSQEVPANGSAGGGVAIVKYNTTTRYLELWGNYQNLAATTTAAHIHSPAPIGLNAPVLITLTHTGGNTGTLTGTATLTAAQETDLLNGLMYVNVHNTTFPGGEIRGQLSTSTAGQTEFFNGRLQGAQEVPPNASTANGFVNVLLDKTRDSVWLTGSFAGLMATATASHIHSAPPNTNGSIFLNINFTAATSGTLHVAAPIIATNENEMISGNTYVNVHNTSFPGGELRGQLTRLSQFSFFKTSMSGSQEVPPNGSVGIGTVIVKYNRETRFLELTGDYQNVSAPITASHIHTAPVGVNGPITISLSNTAGTSGVLSGTATLTPAQEADLFNGNMYVNVHNANFLGGEIRGQLSMTSTGETQYFPAVLRGIQEVPSNPSTATGTATVILDRLTNQVFVTASFAGLAANATAAHLHEAPAGLNGPVIVPLSVTLATSGTVTGSATVTPAFANSMINGLSYINVHNTVFPGGEIRAQLANHVLPVTLTSFSGTRSGKDVVLAWQTAQEINVKQYEIEQQEISRNEWIKKGTVLPNGNSTASSYSFKDLPFGTGKGFVNFRLKIVDLDGRISYSSVVRINFGSNPFQLTIAPNPIVGNQLKFVVTGASANDKAEVTVIDYNGRVVIKATTSTNIIKTISTDHLPRGMYNLTIRVKDLVLHETFSK